MEHMDWKIRKFVYRIRARLKEQSIIDNLCVCAMAGLGFALGISVFSMLVPFYYAVPVAAGVLVIAFVAGMIRGVRKTPSPMEAALRADAKGYKEKISTALFMAGKGDAFSLLLKKEVVGIAERFSVRKEFPLFLSWKKLAVILTLAVSFVVTSMMSTPARELARTRHAVGKEAKEEIARLEKVEKVIEGKKDISEAEKAEVKEQIENAKRELAEAESREELHKATERIAKKMELKSEETENKTLSEELNQAAKDIEEQTEEKKKELAEAARKAMEKAAAGSGRDKKEAYEKLKDLADDLGDEELSSAANNYKESNFSDSDYAAAKSAMNKALDKNDNDKKLANNTAGQNSDSNSNQNSNQNNSQNNQSTENPQNSGNANQNGNGSQNTNQNGSGQQNQNGDGNQGQSGNGNQGQNGNGNGSNGNGNNNSGGAGGGGWNYGSKDGKEGPKKTGEDITVPEGELGNDENLTGKANGNETGTKTESNQANTWSGNKVSYGQVSGKYKDKAYKKINGSDYPGKLKDKIRNYFDGLN